MQGRLIVTDGDKISVGCRLMKLDEIEISIPAPDNARCPR